MKNIQVIDGAMNCTFSIFQATDDEFALLFPEPRQDIQYAEDLQKLSSREIVAALKKIWERPIKKQDAVGIHGTLFSNLSAIKRSTGKSAMTRSIQLRSMPRSADCTEFRKLV